MTREVCGVESFCGRPPNHRGQHGFIQVPRMPRASHEGAPDMAPRFPDLVPRTRDEDVIGQSLTSRQLEALGEVLIHGDHAAAAKCLGISYQTVKNLISAVHARTGAVDSRQATVLLGWTTIPDGVVREHAR